MRNKVLLISGHPNLKASVSNATIISEFRKLCPESEIRCLDALAPDFRFDVAAEQDALRAADVIVLEFPIYWYAMPALLKKWYEDVMTHGFALGSTGNALAGKKVILSFTTGVAEEAYRHDGPMSYEIKEILVPLLQSVKLCQMEVAGCVYSGAMMYVPGVSTEADRKAIEDKAAAHARKLQSCVLAALSGRKPLTIKAVKLYDHGFMTEPFAMGGEDGEDKFDPSVKFRSSLQNYVIDTGDEVILVDTGMPKETPDMVADENSTIYIGKRIEDYVSALKTAGYTPDQVSKIVVTHKHPDHTGELRSFPNAKIYIGAADADDLKLDGPNIVRASFGDGPFYNFPRAQKIADHVYMVEAIGHTRGNSIIFVEDGDRFFLIHGDVTYTDEALYANKLSIVYEDKAAARETLNRIREFIQHHPTIYLSTHTPLGIENLEAERIVDLKVPVQNAPVGEFVYQTASGKYVCSICGYVYDPDEGDASAGIAPGTPFADLPADWVCPVCKRGKQFFNKA